MTEIQFHYSMDVTSHCNPDTKLTDKGVSRKNLYDAEAIFGLSIEPKRGLKSMKEHGLPPKEAHIQ